MTLDPTSCEKGIITLNIPQLPPQQSSDQEARPCRQPVWGPAETLIASAQHHGRKARHVERFSWIGHISKTSSSAPTVSSVDRLFEDE